MVWIVYDDSGRNQANIHWHTCFRLGQHSGETDKPPYYGPYSTHSEARRKARALEDNVKRCSWCIDVHNADTDFEQRTVILLSKINSHLELLRVLAVLFAALVLLAIIITCATAS